MSKSLITTVALSCAIVATAFADPKSISKSEATKIIESMGYSEVKVAFIIQGAVPMAATQNAATVRGVGYFDGKPKKIEQQFFYDGDLGWFCTEDRQDGIGIRIWSGAGYSEVALAPRIVTPSPIKSTTPSLADQLMQRDQQAESKLNETYTRLRDTSSDADKATLKQGHLKWLQEREKLSSDRLKYAEMTETRIKELQARLNK